MVTEKVENSYSMPEIKQNPLKVNKSMYFILMLLLLMYTSKSKMTFTLLGFIYTNTSKITKKLKTILLIKYSARWIELLTQF